MHLSLRLQGLQNTKISTWSNLALQAVNVVYQLAEHPDKICMKLIKNLIRAFLINQSTDTGNESEIDATTNEGIFVKIETFSLSCMQVFP